MKAWMTAVSLADSNSETAATVAQKSLTPPLFAWTAFCDHQQLLVDLGRLMIKRGKIPNTAMSSMTIVVSTTRMRYHTVRCLLEMV